MISKNKTKWKRNPSGELLGSISIDDGVGARSGAGAGGRREDLVIVVAVGCLTLKTLDHETKKKKERLKIPPLRGERGVFVVMLALCCGGPGGGC